MRMDNVDSANFNFPLVNEFVDHVHDAYIEMIMSLAGYMNVIQCVLQINISLGSGYSKSSTMTADPLVQPIGPVPVDPDSVLGTRIMRNKSTAFFNFLRSAFQTLTNDIDMNPAVLVADLRLGDRHHVNMCMRLRPVPWTTTTTSDEPMSSSALALPLSFYFGGGHRHVSMPTGVTAETDGGSNSDSDDNNMFEQDEPIQFYPVTQASINSFMSRMRGRRAESD